MNIIEDKNYTIMTPNELNEIVAEIFGKESHKKMLQIGSAEGDFIISYLSKNRQNKVTGLEINYNSYQISTERLKDSDVILLNEDALLKRDYEKYDNIFCDTPFFQKFSKEQIEQINQDVEFEVKNTTSTPWIYMSKVMKYLESEGKAIIITSEGALFNMKDKDIRQKFIEAGYIETVIALPENIYTYSAIPTSIIILSRNNRKVKFIDATKQFEKQRRINILKKKGIIELIQEKEKSKFINNVSIEEIREKRYILNVNTYMKKNNEKLINPTELQKVSTEIFRGYQITAKEMDELVTEDYSSNDFKILTIGDISDGVVLENLKILKNYGQNYNRYLLKDGDIVISAKGTKIKIACISLKEEKILPTGNLLVIRSDKAVIDPIYLKMFLESDIGIKEIQSIQTGTAIISINVSRLRELEIPLLPIQVQKDLVEKYKIKEKLLIETKARAQQLEKELKALYEDNIIYLK